MSRDLSKNYQPNYEAILIKIPYEVVEEHLKTRKEAVEDEMKSYRGW